MRVRRLIQGVALVSAAALAAGCALFESAGDDFEQSWKGMAATMRTYNEDGVLIDQVRGSSFRVSRDDRFDSPNDDGTDKNDSQVLLISLGNSHISHVGSTMILAEDGIVDVSGSIPASVDLENFTPGTPWLNDLIEKHRNLWRGKAKTLMVRSQNGSPIAIFAADRVEIKDRSGDANKMIPKATEFRLDRKNLIVYRADYTMYDNDLLD